MACQVTDMGPSNHGLTGHIHVGDDETPQGVVRGMPHQRENNG